MKKIISVLLVIITVFSLILGLGGCAEKINQTPNDAYNSNSNYNYNNQTNTNSEYSSGASKYPVEINGQTYYVESQDEINKIIQQQTQEDIHNEIASISNGNAYTAESPMIEIVSGDFSNDSFGGYSSYYFKVRNISDVPICFTTINIDILDEYGDIVDTTHPQEPSTIQSGQAIRIDFLISPTVKEQGAVAATVSSYSLETIDSNDYYSGRIYDAPTINFKK